MAENNLNAYAVLLAGGSGTRLWPVSRELYPKQLVNFIGDDSLVQRTIKRLSPILDPDRIRVVCGKEHHHEIGRHMAEIGVPADGKIICEPSGRNTAPAILLALFDIMKSREDAVLCIFPADHVIRDIKMFHTKLTAALQLAAQGHIVTFGITPDYPETGYGYIEGDKKVAQGALSIKRFVEKPDLPTARQYLEAGNYFWNSGMFAFSASVMREEFARLQPGLLADMTQLIEAGEPLSAEAYQRLEDISIDYAIMEKTDKGVVLPSDFGWSDIGSWKSLYDFLPKDQAANVIDGDVIAEDTHHCFIMGRRLIATNHLRNLVIVETPDSVFVSDMDNSRDVKAIVRKLKEKGRLEYHEHKTVYHPWGSVTELEHKDGYRVDRLTVYPRAQFELPAKKTSLTQHLVLAGVATLLQGDEKRFLYKGDAFALKTEASATIANDGQNKIVLIRSQIDSNGHTE